MTNPAPATAPAAAAVEVAFTDLGLCPPILKALAEDGYTRPTPIQAQTIPLGLAGRDVIGLAQTGTGKTASFALPMLQLLAAKGPRQDRRKPRALVVVPTRELASQVAQSFADYGRHMPLRHVVIFGGVGQKPQENALSRGVDVLIATPGRLIDLINQRIVNLDQVEFLVLDEADRMLDMGFAPDVKRIVARVPNKRQTLFFSATMPDGVRELAESMLKDPARVAVAAVSSSAETVEQGVFHVARDHKQSLLEHLLQDAALEKILVFARTKRGADRVAKKLVQAGFGAEAIHGDKSQGARTRALARFKNGEARILVASDIAARGIDVDGVSHVINLDIPHESETYVHRIGRTGRAGAAGIAWSFCDGEEHTDLRAIERLIKQPIPVISDQPWHDTERRLPPPKPGQQGRGGRGGGGRNGGGGGRGGGGGSSGGGGSRHSAPRRPLGASGGGGGGNRSRRPGSGGRH